jgi:hypothetical protein
MVEVQIELSNELLIELTLYAHKQNMTLNDAIIDILKTQIERYKNG